jgi:hypothetical protein
MKSKTVVFLAATTACLLLAVAAFRLHRRPRRLKITTNDLGYQDHSPEELTSEHLVDLNKLDLLSRMVIPEQVYNAIKQHVGIARATEPVKITG